MIRNRETNDFPLYKRVLNKCGRAFGINPFPRTFPNSLAIDAQSSTEIFERIYNINFWGARQSRSGVGSESKFAARYREKLFTLISDLNFQSMIDAPCGDLNWMSKLLDSTKIAYIGGDIAPAVIIDVQQRLPALDVRRFDICEDTFPYADVWHCRDCLFHLPFSDIHRALTNFIRSEIPYALLTTHKAWVHRNLDTTVGGFRYLDLERAPIGLPPAVHYLPDYRKGVDFPRYVGLWPREQVAAAMRSWAT